MLYINRAYHIFFKLPLIKSPLLWLFGYTFLVISISISIALFDDAFLLIPKKNDLNVTVGVIEDLVDRRRGAYLVVREDLTNNKVIFPNEFQGLSMSKSKLSILKNSIGDPVKILWQVPRVDPLFFIDNKDIWGIEINNRVLRSYDVNSVNAIKSQSGIKNFLIFLLIANFCIAVTT